MRRYRHGWGLLLLLLHRRSRHSSAKENPAWTAHAQNRSEDHSVEPAAEACGHPEDIDLADMEGVPACSVADLLPVVGALGEAQGWLEDTTELTYNCSCAHTKARYFCPHLPSNHSRFTWSPRAVAQRKCSATTRADLSESVLPPGYTVFSMGNSHLRQPVEALMCQFSDQVTSKEVCVRTENLGSTRRIIDGNKQCRGISLLGQEGLVQHTCIDPGATSKAFRCHDDTSSFWFRNGTAWHYQYAEDSTVGVNKSVDNQIEVYNLDPGSINVIVANQGNGKKLTYGSILRTAQGFTGSGTLIIWLTLYDGRGKFNEHQMRTLGALGVVQVDLSAMMSDPRLRELSCFALEGIPHDSHYCLPGPPDEISILLLQIIWAYYHEQSSGGPGGMQ